MYPTGWKHTGEYNSQVSTQISEFATSIEAPTDFVIPCEGAKWVLFAGASDGDAGGNSTWNIYGSQTDHQGSDSFFFNSRVIQLKFHNNSTVKPTNFFPSIGLPNIEEMCELEASVYQDSGANTNESDAAAIESLHFWNRIAGNQAAPGYFGLQSGGSEEPGRAAARPGAQATSQYVGDSNFPHGTTSESAQSIDDTGLPWVAIPTAPFKFLQIRHVNISSNTVALFYNILMP